MNADCQTVTSYDLIGCFQVPTTLDCFFALDAVIDMQVESSAELAPFWQFEPGACNESGLQMMTNEADLAGTCNALNPWTSPGVAGTNLLVRVLGAGHVQLLVSIARSSENPIRLEAGENYYAFHLRVSTGNSKEAGGTCAGCTEKVAIVWNLAVLYSVPNPPKCLDPIVTSLSASGLGQVCVTWNEASAATCAATPARPSTWGQIKAIYR